MADTRSPGRPAVDVVIPCYRYGAMLPDAVHSVLAQDGVDVRILIIDDASDDGSAQVALGLAAADDRVTVRVHERNMGHVLTYNEGILGWASAEYTLLLSADDAITPGALARATALMQQHPSVGFVYGLTHVWQGDTLPTHPAPVVEPRFVVHPGARWLRRRVLLGENCVPTPTAVVRTSVQHRVGGHNADIPHTADFEIWMRFALQADVGFVANQHQGYSRVHGSNMSTPYETADSGVRALRERMAAILSVLGQAGDRLPDVADLERRMRRRLATDAIVKVSRSYDKGRVDDRLCKELIDFATEAAGDVTALPAWQFLRLRQHLGPRIVPALRPLVVTAAVRRVRQRLRDRKQQLSGV